MSADMYAHAIAQFSDALRAAGLTPEAIHADGELHRFSSNGKRGDEAGWYVLHLDSGIPAGAFGDWRTGLNESWRADIGRSLTDAERAAQRELIAACRRKREAAEAERHAEAQKRAQREWRDAMPADASHPYLVRKGVQPHGLRVDEAGRLLVPVQIAGELHSLQYIDADGTKRFLPGGRMAGGYYAIGKSKEVICIAEGFATAATIHEATGHAVAVAFNCGNLAAVARTVRERLPKVKLIVCADDDATTDGNPGTTKATEAARAVGASLAIPDFGTDRPEKATDFNDLAAHGGADAVRACIASATQPSDCGARAQDETLRFIPADSITPEPIRWLWTGWLARGKKHVLAGAPGTGKTTIALALAAIVTKGGTWPDGTRAPAGNVVIWSGEDDPKDVLVPRLIAAGADLSRVYFVGDVSDAQGDTRAFDPARDVPLLESRIVQIGGAVLAIVDPVVNAVAGDSHKNGEVRRALAPLVELGQRHDVAVLGISHFSKGTAGREPLERVTGSLAFGALARIVLVAAKAKQGDDEPTAQRLFARAKSNIGPDDGGFAYQIEFGPLPTDRGIETSWVVWGDPVDGSARELLAEMEPADDDDGSAIDDAVDFLRDFLAHESRPVADIKKAAAAAGHAWITVRRAKGRLGMKKPQKEAMSGGWRWGPAPEGAQGSGKLSAFEGAQRMPKVLSTQSGAPSGVNEHLRDSDPSDDGWEPVE